MFGRFAPYKRFIGWTIAVLFLYSVSVAFVMVFSLASAYEKFQVLGKGASLSKSIDKQQLLSLQNDARMAHGASNDPTVRVLELLPFLGSDIHAARVLSVGLDENLQAVGPLLEQRDALDLGKIVLPKTVQALSNSIDALDSAMKRFDTELQRINPNDLHFGLQAKVKHAKALVGDASIAVHEGAPMVKTASILLNKPGKSRWFVATQNAAELRASGGLLGSYAVITVDNGKVMLTDYGADAKLLEKGKLHVSFPDGVGNPWGADLADWRDLNVSSHIPDNGQIIVDAWQEKYHQKLDGVVFFSQGTVAHLVGAVGGIEISGQRLNASNTVEFLTKDIYAKYPNVKVKNQVVSSLMQQLFNRLSNSRVDSAKLFASLANSKNSDRVYLWARDGETSSQIAKSGLDGAIDSLLGPKVVIGLNNGGGNKLDAYLKSSYEYRLGACSAKTWDGLPGRAASVQIRLTNTAPKTGLPRYVNPRLDLRKDQKWIPGSNREVVSVYAPVGSTDEQFFIDGAEDGALVTTSHKHPLYVLSIELNPGQTRNLTIKFIEPIVNEAGQLITVKPSLRTQGTLGGSSSSVYVSEICKIG